MSSRQRTAGDMQAHFVSALSARSGVHIQWIITVDALLALATISGVTGSIFPSLTNGVTARCEVHCKPTPMPSSSGCESGVPEPGHDASL